MLRALVVFGLAMLGAGCMGNGYYDESGHYNLGPNALGDDPIPQQNYPSYAEYAVAHHELDEMAKDGWSHDQQICFARVMLDHIRRSSRDRLNDYATGKVILMESEFSALTKEVRQQVDPQLSMAMSPDLKQKCGMQPNG